MIHAKEFPTQIERDLHLITIEMRGTQYHYSVWLRDLAQQTLDLIETQRHQIEASRSHV